MVLSAIQAPWHLTWSYQHKSSPSFFVIDGLDCCITTINSNLTQGRMLFSLAYKATHLKNGHEFSQGPAKHLFNLSSILMPASSSLTLEPPLTCGTDTKTSLHVITSHVKNKNKTKCWESMVKPLSQLE